MLAQLGTATHNSSYVYHGTFIDVGPDIHVRGHEYNTSMQESTIPSYRGRHYPYT